MMIMNGIHAKRLVRPSREDGLTTASNRSAGVVADAEKSAVGRGLISLPGLSQRKSRGEMTDDYAVGVTFFTDWA